jgi:hypothetical protein
MAIFAIDDFPWNSIAPRQLKGKLRQRITLVS